MCCSPYSSAASATYGIFRSEGFRAFYRSYTTQLSMNIPFQAVVVTTYTLCQKLLNPEGKYYPVVHFVAGATAGSVACIVTMPFDVCKTLLNTQEAGVLSHLKQAQVVGMYGAARAVTQVKGVPGFFQGLTARVVYQAPGTAISWSVYEFFKYYMKRSEASKAANDGYESIKDIKLTVSAKTAATP